VVFSIRLVDQPGGQKVPFELSLGNSSALNVSVQGGHDPKVVSIRDSDISSKIADFVKISFSGNRGQDIRIYQELDSPLKNAMGHELAGDALLVNGKALRVGKTLVFTGSKDRDHFCVYFLVDPNKINQQDAGSYIGKIKYVLETNQVRQEFSLDIQCAVQPVFTMDVSEPSGGAVTVMVMTNLHQHYQVLQNFQKIMVNANGKAWNTKDFLMKVVIGPDEPGYTNFADFAPVTKGEYPIFSSDAQGSPVEFKVVYRLEGYDKIAMGHFLAPIKFSLNQK